MKICIISSSPNKKGLTVDCVNQCVDTISKEGNECAHFCLNKYDILRCQACGNRGWGMCLKEHRCTLHDDFNRIYEDMSSYDGYIFITPVYFHEMSESAKTFFDRLKRVDVFFEESKIKGKKLICIACAGGTGTGTKFTLRNMNKLSTFLQLKIVSEIGVNKVNKQDKMIEIKDSVRKMMM